APVMATTLPSMAFISILSCPFCRPYTQRVHCQRDALGISYCQSVLIGFLLQVAALRMVPIYVVAAALASSIAVTGIVSAWLLSARLSRPEWTAVGVVCVSLFVLACAAGPAHFRRAPTGLGWALVGVVAAIFIAGAAAGRLPDRVRALALGLGSGTGFGVV